MIYDNKVTKKRVLFLGDSHLRNCSAFIRESFSNKEVDVIYKPGAQLGDVVSDLKNLTKDFTKNDSVFIIGGTNNFPNNYSNLINDFF